MFGAAIKITPENGIVKGEADDKVVWMIGCGDSIQNLVIRKPVQPLPFDHSRILK